jgi:hypothetical protein
VSSSSPRGGELSSKYSEQPVMQIRTRQVRTPHEQPRSAPT